MTPHLLRIPEAAEFLRVRRIVRFDHHALREWLCERSGREAVLR